MQPRRPTGSGAFTRHLHDFVATLRTAGIAVGSSSWLDAAAAAAAVGLNRRDDLQAALAAALVDRHEAMPLFEQAFAVYFARPELLHRLAADDLPQLLKTPRDEPPAAAARRLLEALSRPRRRRPGDSDEQRSGLPGASALEALIDKDFAQMTLAELAAAKRLLRTAVPALPERPVRRYRASRYEGPVDLGATLRSTVRHDGEAIALQRRRRRARTVPLTLLIDISGSMSAYSRVLLHFAHCLTRRYRDVETFVFGTRLSRVTRELAGRDIDATLAALAGAVRDWDGGTRISAALAAFNRRWARRVLARGSVVALFSDGLEREPDRRLAAAAERLSLNAWRLLWLNPLLGYPGFEPRAEGIRLLLPHVDALLPGHSIASLSALGDALTGAVAHRQNPQWRRHPTARMLVPPEATQH